MTGRMLLIGAGWEQRPLAERAAAEGFDVVGCGTGRADWAGPVSEFHSVDPRDLVGLLGLARDLDVDYVVSDQDDYARYAQAWLCEHLGLPGPRLDAVAPTTMKHVLRRLCAEAGIRQPEHRLVMSPSDARRAAEEVGWPVVVKPTDNRGSFGVVRVDGPDDLDEALLEALAHSHSRLALVERFIDGTVVTVDGAHLPHGHQVLGVASKRQLDGRRQVAVEISYPARLPEAAVRLATEAADGVAGLLSRLGATGLTHTEFVWDGEGMWLLESANRGGGVFTSNVIIPAHSGFDTLSFLLREATGVEAVDARTGPGQAVMLSFFMLGRGRLQSVEGLDQVASAEGVLEARLLVGPGDHLGDVETAAGRAGFAIVAGGSLAEVESKLARAMTHVSVTFESEEPPAT